MSSLVPPGVEAIAATLRKVRLSCAAALAALGLSVLAGWHLGIPHLTQWNDEGFVAMKPNTAFCFLLGSAVLLLAERAPAATRIAQHALSLLIFIVAALTLGEYVLHIDLGFDDWLAPIGVSPPRMSPVTATLFILLGSAGVLSESTSSMRTKLCEAFCMAVCATSFVMMLGYLYDLSSLFTVNRTISIALPTSAGLFCYGTGLLSMRSSDGLIARFADSGPAGVVARRLFPATIVAPLVLGWLRLQGQHAHLYGTEFGLALFASANVLCFWWLSWWTSGVLMRMDSVRERAERDLASSQQNLALSHDRYRALFESAPEAIVILDLERGTFIEVNENATRLFGYTKRELERMSPLDLSPERQPDGRLSREAVPALIESALAGEKLCFEWVHLNSKKEEIPCEIRLAMMPGTTRQCRGSIIDISDRKRAEAARTKLEETLRQTQDQLRQSQKMDAIGRLAGGVAHDFNNLLSVILGHVSLLLDQTPVDNPQHRSLQQVADASERAAKLTSQLLAFSRQQVLSVKSLDLNDVLRELGEMLRRLIGEDIELALSLRASGRVLANASQIEQVVMNLVVNARDAMPQGGRLLIESYDEELDEQAGHLGLGAKPGTYVALAVTDTGCGMDTATQERIFEPFFTTKEQGKGTGLGLSMVFGIAQQSGGHVSVMSRPSRGTTVKVCLPACAESFQEVTAVRTVSRKLHGNETVLLVEDDEQVRTLAHAILERYGYTVLAPLSSVDALRVAEQFPGVIHLLLTDVVMPRMSGQELAQRVRVLRPDTKILFMSGYTGDHRHHLDLVTRAGESFVQKPLLPEVLASEIRALLDTRISKLELSAMG